MRVFHIALGAMVGIGAMGLAGIAQADHLFFEGDMVRGHDRNLGSSGPGCVLTSQYMRQEWVVFRVRVTGENGDNLGDDTLKSVTVELGNGDKVDMGFGQHPRGEPTDSFWATSWQIPADYPTGALGYKVIAVDKEGTAHEWEPFKVANSQLTVIPGEVTWEK